MTRVYVPREASALSLGAEAVAAAIAAEAARRGLGIDLVRNGSHGACWLEPLVEAATPAGRIAYGPVQAADVPGLFDAGFLHGSAHPLCQGPTAGLAWLRQQERLVFARAGLTDPLSTADYRAHGGHAGLRRALEMAPVAIVDAVTESGLRGRGGAAFPTGLKWRTVLGTQAAQKYIVCNADEGDSGTFADRLLIEGDPYLLIEGMTIAALAVGATQGYVYLRSEYPHAETVFAQALVRARVAGWLGADVLGSGRAFDIELRRGAGAYICGEETALLESLEGRRGTVRAKPPLPAVAGLFGQPTVINNVITFASVPCVLAEGPAAYRDYGAGRSRGTLPIQLAGNVRRGGLIEKAFGITLGELLHDWGGGSASGRPIRAVQVGGPLGAWLGAADFDLPLDYEAFAARGALLGHGGIVVFDDSVDLARMARHAFAFCALESCGKCTPCRIGSTRGVELMDRLLARRGPLPAAHATRAATAGSTDTAVGRPQTAEGVALAVPASPMQVAAAEAVHATAEQAADFELLRDLCDTLTHASLCALGGLTPYPVTSAIERFPEDFGLATPAEARHALAR